MPQSLHRLHAQHGQVVRIAPHEYSINDPGALNIVYGRRSQFNKSNFYAASELPGHPNLFSQRDPIQHDRDRRKYNFAFTMRATAITTYEKYIDECIGMLRKRLQESAESQKVIDMAWWLHCFSFDVIGAILFSKRFGFLDNGQDISRLIETIHGNAFYATVFGIFHELYPLVFRVKAILSQLGLISSSGQAFMQTFATGLLNERMNELANASTAGQDPSGDDNRPKDFLTKYLKKHFSGPNAFTRSDILNGLGANINAGSDTTSITISAVLYFLHRNPATLQALRTEIDNAHDAGLLSHPATFKEVQSLPYLQEVIKESLRLHPAVGVTLPRVVPVGGIQITGHSFPAGEIVGISPYVAHRNQDVFGADANDFKPERWLKSHTDPETLAAMERYFLPFGAGSRSCIGRNVALMEIAKTITELVRRFDFELLEKDEWKVRTWLFSMPESLNMKARQRAEGQQ